MPRLAFAFTEREKFVAAFACARSALDAGASELELRPVIRRIELTLGEPLVVWKVCALELSGKRP
jgi:hypothetical protein